MYTKLRGLAFLVFCLKKDLQERTAGQHYERMEDAFNPETRGDMPLYATFDAQRVRTPSMIPSEQIWSAYRLHQLVLRIDKTKRLTYCCNITTVASDLQVPVEHLAKYLSISLNTRGRFKNTNSARGVEYCLQGCQELQNVSNAILQFIFRWMLCTRCGLPELERNWKKREGKNTLKITCRACWKKATLSDFSYLNDTFRYYVLNNPPNSQRLATHLFIYFIYLCIYLYLFTLDQPVSNLQG